jgi:hypothetical protein
VQSAFDPHVGQSDVVAPRALSKKHPHGAGAWYEASAAPSAERTTCIAHHGTKDALATACVNL